MFNNIGQKIQTVASLIFTLGVIASFIYGGLFYAQNNSSEAQVIAVLIIIGGCIGSWFSVLVLYGFGQLIINTDVIRKKLEDIADYKYITMIKTMEASQNEAKDQDKEQ